MQRNFDASPKFSGSKSGGSNATPRSLSGSRQFSGNNAGNNAGKGSNFAKSDRGSSVSSFNRSGASGRPGEASRANFVSRNFKDSGNINKLSHSGNWNSNGKGSFPGNSRGPGDFKGGDGKGGDGKGGGKGGDWNRGDSNRGDWAKGKDWNHGNWNKGNWSHGNWNGNNNWHGNNWHGNNWNNNWWGGNRGWWGYGNRGWGWGGGFYSPWIGWGWGWGYPFFGFGSGLGWPYYGQGYGGWGGYGYGAGSGYYSSYPATTVYSNDYAAATDQQPALDQQAPPDAAERASQFVSAGEEAFQAGRYDEALRDWQHSMVDSPNNGAVVLLMAQALFALGQYEAAANTVQGAMQMLPEAEWGNVVKNYTQLYPDIQKYTDQIRAAEKARDAKPDDAAIHFLLGYHFGYLNYPKQSVGELDKALDLEPKDVGAQKLRAMFATAAGMPARPVPPAANEGPPQAQPPGADAPPAIPPQATPKAQENPVQAPVPGAVDA